MKIKFVFVFLHVSMFLLSQPNYFQQHVDYRIRVKLNDLDHSLTGDIQMVYKNNSPVILDKIGMHLWPNAYKNKATAFAKQKLKHRDTRFYDAPEEELGYIDQLDFKVNGSTSNLEYVKDNPDMAWLILPTILKPGDSIMIATPFHVKLPESFSRLGHAGQTYQITQWYPKPAVYDHKGWHLMPYLDQGEFYSEFGDFDVQISLPKNYIVGATGILQNEEELSFLNHRVELTQKAIQKKKLVLTETPPSDPEYKTLRYLAENVHDFAWFADKTFYVQKSQVTLNSGNKVDTWTMFNDLQLWDSSIAYINRSLEFYSKHVGDYPWPQATAVESALSAGGGMEYPMITVIGPSYTKQNLDEVITHEVGHNWFYGILASNEREHPYMDEGINTYYENRYMKTYYSNPEVFSLPYSITKWLGKFNMPQMMYLAFARSFSDQHPNQPADHFNIINYGNDVYYKTSTLFAYAESAIGTSSFDSIMQHYYQTWKFKHPYPEDLEQIFAQHSGTKSKWLFDGFLNSNEKMDYGFCKLEKNANQLSLTLKNHGNIAAPFTLTAIKENKVVEEKWIDGFKGKKIIDYPNGDYDFLAIDYDHKSYDLYDCNNYIKTKGLFKKTEPVHLKIFPLMDGNGSTDIGITPVIGSNSYNGFMAGAFISGPWFPYKKWSFNVMPLYGFQNHKLAGQSAIRYTWFLPGNNIKSVSLGFNAKSYAYNEYKNEEYLNYYQLNPNIKLTFSHLPPSFKSSELRYDMYWIRDEVLNFFENDSIPFIESINRVNHQLKYTFSKASVLGDFNFEANLNYLNQKFSTNLNQELLRLQLTLKKSFRYHSKWFFDSRFYFAFYPINSERHSSYISSRSQPNFYRGSTGLAYRNYLDDDNQDLFIGRSENDGLWSQQIFEKQGGFKWVPNASQRSNLGNSNQFVCSANFSIDLPLKTIGHHFRPYFDIGYFEQSGLSTKDKILFSGGINVRVVTGLLDIYFPIFHSQNIRDLYKSQNNHTYWQEVSFSLKLRKPVMDDLLHMIGY